MENARVPISIADFQGVKSAAEAAVDVPQNVVDLIVDLRAHLQNKCEPPVYVSDRRLVKSIALLRVAAYTNGRSAVSEFDCLLLANVLWQRPSESNVIRDWILERLAQDRGVDQVQYLLAGLFGRARRADGDPAECAELREEAARLREVLSSQMQSLAGATSGSMPALRDHLWLSPPDAERAAQTLGPLFGKVRRAVSRNSCGSASRWRWRWSETRNRTSWRSCCRTTGRISFGRDPSRTSSPWAWAGSRE